MSKTRKNTGRRSPSPRTRRTSDAVAIIDHTIVADDTQLREMIEHETVNALVAQEIYDARRKAGLTQKQLAQRIGTKQPVVSQLEDADYEGHSLSMLRRIATALDRRIEIKLVSNDADPKHAGRK